MRHPLLSRQPHKVLHAKVRGKEGMSDVEGLAAAAAAAWR